MKTLKKIKLNGLNDAELRDREMAVIGHVVAVAIMKVAEVLLPIIMELPTITSVLAVEIQLVDVLLMVVILYLEQLYNNEPCSKYAVR